jgi:hypothetical protein
MRTYVFFNKNTGEIVHTHQLAALIGDALPIPTEELRTGPLMEQLADRIDPGDVEVLDVTGNDYLLRRVGSPDDTTALVVDVEEQVISEREKSQ